MSKRHAWFLAEPAVNTWLVQTGERPRLSDSRHV